MKKISLFLSMIAFVSFIAIGSVSAKTDPVKPVVKKATTTKTVKPASTKACCADAGTAKCTMGKDGKVCPEMAKKPAPAPQAK
jgi:hypothetical protein